MTLPDRFTYAIQLAATVHKGQKDKGGEPYILHALHVMHTVETTGQFMSEGQRHDTMIIAVLHDAIEDFDGNPGEKAEFRDHIHEVFGGYVWASLLALTKKNGETYENYIERVAEHPAARRVKIADLTHNMDTGRLPEGDIGESDFQRWDKYRRALVRLKRED